MPWIADLNCDVGELEDAAHEAALLGYVSSANVACGGHAGDAHTMDRTVRLALARGVRIGAHPGYPDRAGFGRVDLPMTEHEIAREVRRQIEALDAVVRAAGGSIGHVKPHGALYNRAARDAAIARAIGEAVAGWNPRAVLFGLAGSVMLETWRSMGFAVSAEGFADRAYQPDGTLRPRSLPGALITDPAEAAAQALRLVREGRANTICVHGDTPGALSVLKSCREALLYGQ